MPHTFVLRASARLALLGGLLALAAIAAPAIRPQTAVAAGDCTVDATIDAEEAAFLQLINAHRAQNGRAPLKLSYTLTRAAQWKSVDLATNNYFAHDDLNRTWVQRIRDCGYGFNTYLGENIAAGGGTAQQAFNQWKNSSGHNQNMLNSSYTAIGIGRHFLSGSTYGWYWTTEFGGFSDGWVQALEPSQPLPVLPELTITSPAPGRSYQGHVAMAAQPKGGVPVTAVDFVVDGALVRRDVRAPYSARLNTRRLAPGPHTVTVRAVHADGRITERSVSIVTRR